MKEKFRRKEMVGKDERDRNGFCENKQKMMKGKGEVCDGNKQERVKRKKIRM